MNEMFKISKFIYKVAGFPVYFYMTKTNEYFVKVKGYRGIKNENIFSLMQIKESTHQITHEEFSNYIETYNTYLYYMDEMSTQIKSSKRKYTRRKDI